MKHLFTYHGHIVIVDYRPGTKGLHYEERGVTVHSDTCAVSLVICKAAIFASENNIRSLVVDGVELKRDN
jgi:hypothetical protein